MIPPRAYFERIGTLLATMQVRHRDMPATLESGCAEAVERLLEVRRRAAKIVLVGNGGSASIAGHMQMDLSNRVGVRAQVFHDPPVLTALANDHGYAGAFERLTRLWIASGDCLIAISSSGRSENIVRSVAAARAAGAAIITFSGFSPDNPLAQLADLAFYVDSQEYGEVEVAHHALGHYLTDCAASHAEAR
ncbi:MAG TPA: SIS domain-containing protein [Terriglobales bacterium]|nr:SIS domain-containing protein [Terriglobales bacterium]